MSALPCADRCPWDAAILCDRPVGHTVGLHTARSCDGLVRWADHCHFPGDSCPTGSHLDSMEETPWSR